jgi:hypothetical protein
MVEEVKESTLKSRMSLEKRTTPEESVNFRWRWALENGCTTSGGVSIHVPVSVLTGLGGERGIRAAVRVPSALNVGTNEVWFVGLVSATIQGTAKNIEDRLEIRTCDERTARESRQRRPGNGPQPAGAGCCRITGVVSDPEVAARIDREQVGLASHEGEVRSIGSVAVSAPCATKV